MGELMKEPVLTLTTHEEVKEAISQNMREVWKKQPHPYMWEIKSIWLCELIEEIATTGQYPYNATVKQEAEKRLGLPAQPEVYYCREGDTLSLLIYNAQKFRHSDKLKAQGFQMGTEEVLAQAFQEKRKLLTASGNTLTVKEVSGKLYAFKPRKRKFAVEVVGYPIRFVTVERES